MLVAQSRENLGPLAQSVEQRTFNPWVVGSIPTGPTSHGLKDEKLLFNVDCYSVAAPLGKAAARSFTAHFKDVSPSFLDCDVKPNQISIHLSASNFSEGFSLLNIGIEWLRWILYINRGARDS